MVDIKELENEMNEQKVTDAEMAKIIGKDISTWYRRKLAPQTFLIGEIENIVDSLSLSDEKAIHIFLA